MEIIKYTPNDLLEVKEDVEEHIQAFVEEKIEGAEIPERAREEIECLQEELIIKVKEQLEELNSNIDDIIEEFSEDHLYDIKADFKAQESKEADLWN